MILIKFDNDWGELSPLVPQTTAKKVSNENKAQKPKTAFDLLGDFETETIETPVTIESNNQNEFEADFDLFANMPPPHHQP